MISKLPLSAAMCKGVAPPALIFTFAPAYTLENAKVRVAEEIFLWSSTKLNYKAYSEETQINRNTDIRGLKSQRLSTKQTPFHISPDFIYSVQIIKFNSKYTIPYFSNSHKISFASPFDD